MFLFAKWEAAAAAAEQIQKIWRRRLVTKETRTNVGLVTSWVYIQKMGHPRTLFVYFRSFQTTVQISQQLNWMRKMIHPVQYGAGIWTHDILLMSLLQ